MSLKGIAQETLKILEDGGFTAPDSKRWVPLKDELDRAVAQTSLYTPDTLEVLLDTPPSNSLPQDDPSPVKPRIEVTPERTQVAAQRLVVDEGVDNLALLNFASARNAGGGFITGAKAQEEDLTRCSGLYPCLLTQPAYYETNRAQKSLIYTDHMIYSPGVPWFRTRSRNLLDHIFLASVITAPAPNAGEVLRRDSKAGPKIEARMRRRCGMVLAVARDQGHRDLILGAWGCGVFRNEPAMVADAFGTWLESPEFQGAFDRVTFAILTNSKNRSTLTAFEERFRPQS